MDKTSKLMDIIQNTNSLSELVHRNIPEDKKYNITFYLNK